MARSIDDYTEEMLLGDGRGQRDGPTDTEVRTSDGSDNVVKRMQRFLNKIPMECDKALSKTMRTSDPRNEVWGAVQKAVALESECIKNLIEEVISDAASIEVRAEDAATYKEVLELLEVAGLLKFRPWNNFLDEAMQNKGALGTLTALMHCSGDKLVEKVGSLVKLVSEQNETIKALEEKLNTSMLQMKELSTRMEHMGDERSSGLAAVLDERNGPEPSVLENYYPRLLLAIAQRRLQQLKGHYVGHR